MRKIFFFLAFMIFCGNAFGAKADSGFAVDSTVRTKIYHVNYPIVSVIIAGGFISDYYGVKRIKNKPSITLDELHFLSSQAQIDLINPFDRWGLRQKASDRDKYNTLSNNTLTGIVLVPCFLLLDKKIRKDWPDILMIYIEGHSITLANYCYNFLGPTYEQRFHLC